MKAWNRVLAMLLASSMVLSNAPLTVFAQEPGTEGQTTSAVTDGTGAASLTQEGTDPTAGTTDPTVDTDPTAGTTDPTVDTDPTTGTTDPTVDTNLIETGTTLSQVESALSQADPAVTVHDGFTWNDKSGVLSGGVFNLSTVSADHPISLDGLVKMLPPSLILEDGKEVAVNWKSDSFQADGAGGWPVSGDHVFTAAPAEEITFSEQAPKREILVKLSNEVSMLQGGAAYADKDGKPQNAAGAAEIQQGTAALSQGWYVVTGNVAVSQRIQVSGDVNLILADGGCLTANGGIDVPEGASLTVYGQNQDNGNDTGQLLLRGEPAVQGAGSITSYGGLLYFKDLSCYEAESAKITGKGRVGYEGCKFFAVTVDPQSSENATINVPAYAVEGAPLSFTVTASARYQVGILCAIGVTNYTLDRTGDTFTLEGMWVHGDVSLRAKTTLISPTVVMDYRKETLGTTSEMEWRHEGASEISACTDNMALSEFGWSGQQIKIRLGWKGESSSRYRIDVIIPARPAAPAEPAAADITASSVTLTQDTTQGKTALYRVTGGDWQAAAEFTGLSADTEYTFYTRFQADDNAFASEISQAVIRTLPVFTFDETTGTIIKYNGAEANVVLPPEIGGKPVKAVQGDAFANTAARQVTVRSSMALRGDLIMNDGQTLMVDENVTLTIQNTQQQTDPNGTAVNKGTVINNGNIDAPDAQTCYVLRQQKVGGNITVLGKAAYSADLATGAVSANMKIPNIAVADSDYVFEVVPISGYEADVSYQIGGGEKIALTGTGNKYTIPGAEIRGDVKLYIITPASAPQVAIDYAAETLNTTANMQWAPAAEDNWTACTADMQVSDFGWNGSQAVTVRFRVGNSDRIQTLTLPARPAAPKLTFTAAGVTVPAGMECQTRGDTSWTAGSGEAVIPGRAGDFLIRRAAMADSFAGVSQVMDYGGNVTSTGMTLNAEADHPVYYQAGKGLITCSKDRVLLENAEISTQNEEALDLRIQGVKLSIDVVGTNSLTGGQYGIRSSESITFLQCGSLTAVGQTGAGIFSPKASVTVGCQTGELHNENSADHHPTIVSTGKTAGIQCSNYTMYNGQVSCRGGSAGLQCRVGATVRGGSLEAEGTEAGSTGLDAGNSQNSPLTFLEGTVTAAGLANGVRATTMIVGIQGASDTSAVLTAAGDTAILLTAQPGELTESEINSGTVNANGVTKAIACNHDLTGAAGKLSGTGVFQANTTVPEALTIQIPEPLTYTGKALDPDIRLSLIVLGQPFEVPGWTRSFDKGHVEDAGDYRVSFHKNGITREQAFTVLPAEITGSVSQKGSLVYNSSAQTALYSSGLKAVAGQPITLTFGTAADACNSDTVPGFTDAGTYTVYYCASAPNHKDLKGQFSVTIGKAQAADAKVTVPAPAPMAVPQTVCSGSSCTGTITWEGTLTDGRFGFRTVYTAHVTLTPDGNHSFTEDALASAGLADAALNGDGTITGTMTFPATRRAKVRSVAIPEDQDVMGITADSAMAELPGTVTITAEDGTTALPVIWELLGTYDPAPKAQNSFQWTADPGALDGTGQPLSGRITTTNMGNVLVTQDPALTEQTGAWVDGAYVPATKSQDGATLILPDDGCRSMVTYTYNGGSADPHSQYPTGMQVWLLRKVDGVYQARRVQELDDLLTYAGCSIRLKGKNGIRMITAVDNDMKSALVSNGLGGCRLVEYGTVVAWTEDLNGQAPTLGGAGCKSNYAYRRGVADPVFKNVNGQAQYTNVLVGFSLDDCRKELSMRPYMLLEDESGQQISVYGGTVQRSIGYIAYQNRDAFPKGSAESDYVWNIIHHVYGEQFG